MKYLAILFLVILIFISGYSLGSKRVVSGAEEQIDLIKFVEDEQSVRLIDELKSTKPREFNKKKKTINKKMKIAKHLSNIMRKAPFSLVQKTYRAREKELELAAFGGRYDRGKWKSSKRKDIDAIIFKDSMVIMKKNLFYISSGFIVFEDQRIPFNIATDFKPLSEEKSKRYSSSNNVMGVCFSLRFNFDISLLDLKKKEYSSEMMSCGYDLISDTNLLYIKYEMWHGNGQGVFKDINYLLVGLPLVVNRAVSILGFNSLLMKWIVLSEDVRWRPVSSEEYSDFNRDSI